MTKYRLLVVEDDVALRQALDEQFALHAEFVLDFTDSAGAAIDKITTGTAPDLVLLDIGLPDQDGRETCKILRQKGLNAPIIMLTGATTDADMILGLDAGANDYVTKPFRFGVLLARIRAQLRQYETTGQAELTIGPYLFRPTLKILEQAGGAKIRLTEKETGILRYLLRTAGQVVSREQLLHEVWGYNAQVTTHTLETHIYRLRQKIELDPSDTKILLTAEGGYRLNAEADSD